MQYLTISLDPRPSNNWEGLVHEITSITMETICTSVAMKSHFSPYGIPQECLWLLELLDMTTAVVGLNWW